MLETFTPPPFITFAIPAFFVLIGIEIAIGRFQNKELYRLNDSIADLSTGIISQLWGLFQKGISLGAYFFLFENFRFFEISMSDPIAWVLCFIGWDFCYYWLHRTAHEVNFFWAGHVIHHHSEEYNLVVALRQTGLGGLFSWIFYIPLAFIGFPPWMFLASGQFNLIYQFWVHTKAVKSIGTVGEFVLSTPSHHRVHHAVNPKYIDRNHGGILIIWDRLFGTFQKEEEPCVYGTVKPLKSFNPVFANFHYYWELVSQAWNAQGILNKIKVFIMRPGWVPAKDGEPSHYLPIPEVTPERFEKYDPKPNAEIRSYTLAWFIGILLFAFAFLLFLPKFTLLSRVLISLWVTISLLSVNGLMEQKSWARQLEIFRHIFTFSLLGYFELGYVSFVLGLVFLLQATYFLFKTNDSYGVKSDYSPA